MTYHLSQANGIIRDVDGASIPRDQANSDYQDYLAWVADGNTPRAYVVPTPTQDDYKNAIQAFIDQTAVTKSYTDGVSCASYKDSTVQAWAAEAAAFISWRDNVWTYAFNELEKVQSGARAPQPSIAEILSELPTIVWP